MFLRRTQADDPDRLFIRALNKHHDEEFLINPPDRDDPHFAIVETVVFSLDCAFPLEPGRGL